MIEEPFRTIDEALDEFVDAWLEDEPRSVIIAALAAKIDELMGEESET